MANAPGHGGYRKPDKPAPYSGPGKYSKRTDGGPAQAMSTVPGQDYGQATAQMNAQRVAPMAGTAPMPKPADAGTGDQGAPQMPTFNGSPLNAPSNRPGEPVTAGVDIGPGAGPEALNFQPIQQGAGTGQMTALLQKYAATDTTGILAQLMQAAQARNA